MSTDESTDRQLARIEQKVDGVLIAIDELKSEMKDGRDHRNSLDTRVTRLETKMEDVDTVKKQVIGVLVGLAIFIIIGIAVLAQYASIP
jgi:tetrahydromethanopterin S-methyltransferase subunit G